MIEPSSVFVVVPAFNEAAVITRTLQALIGADYSVVVVDDGSSDETWAITSGLPVYVLRHAFNLGQGAALQTGMEFALRMGARFLVHFDGDGQHRAADIGMLLQPLESNQADVVFGSRFLRSEDAAHVPRVRRWILKIATLVNALLTGLWLSDAHNGLRALSENAARCVQLRETGFAHASEIMWQVKRAGLRCVERPTLVVYSDYSIEKGQRLSNAINIVWDVVMRRVFK